MSTPYLAVMPLSEDWALTLSGALERTLILRDGYEGREHDLSVIRRLLGQVEDVLEEYEAEAANQEGEVK